MYNEHPVINSLHGTAVLQGTRPLMSINWEKATQQAGALAELGNTFYVFLV